jgi:hypothetical protein
VRLTATRVFVVALLVALIAAIAYLKVHRRRGWTSVSVELSPALERSGVVVAFATSEHSGVVHGSQRFDSDHGENDLELRCPKSSPGPILSRFFYRQFLNNWHQSLTLNVKCDGTLDAIACTVIDNGEVVQALPKSCSTPAWAR